MMNYVGKLPFAQPDLGQAQLCHVAIFIELDRAMKSFRGARRLAELKKTFTNSGEQHRVLSASDCRQSERRARTVQQPSISERRCLRSQQPCVFVNQPGL